MKVKVLVILSCSTLCDPMDCSLPGSCIYGDSLGKTTGVGCHPLLQGIFTTQGLNPGLLHCRQILYHLSHQGSPSAHEVDHYYWPLQLHVFGFFCNVSEKMKMFQTALSLVKSTHCLFILNLHLTSDL